MRAGSASVFLAALAIVPASAGRLLPADLKYQGAFQLPSHTKFEFGGEALTYYPGGDKNGTVDGFPGSLYVSGTTMDGEIRIAVVAEVAIPAPSKDFKAMTRGALLQEFKDLRAFPLPYGEARMDMEFLPKQGSQTSDKLYYTWGSHYSFGGEFGMGLSWSELDLAKPDIAGGWYVNNGGAQVLSTFHTGDFLFSVPEIWANKYTPGKLLVTGRFRDGGLSGRGPAMFAVGPWNEGNPPATGAKIPYTTLLLYDNENTVVNYSHDDSWKGAAFLGSGEKSAVVLVGTKALGTTWYGENTGCGGSKGYWSDSAQAQMIFYDTDELGEVALGKKPTHAPQPYAVLNIDPFLSRKFCTNEHNHTAAIAVDRLHGYLFVLEPMADDWRPIVHVFKVENDMTAPTQVTGLKADAAGGVVELSWSSASDPETKIAAYEIYRGASASPTALLAKVGDVTAYADSSAPESSKLYYRIRAVNGSGMPGDAFSADAQVDVPADAAAPKAIAVEAAGNLAQIEVVFSEALAEASAEATSNYKISDGVTVVSATLAEDGKTVILKTTEHRSGSDYTVTVSGVRDIAKVANVLASATLTYKVESKLLLKITAPGSYATNMGAYKVGDPVYVDRAFRIAKMFDGYNEAEYVAIKTANDDKASAAAAFLSFESNLNVEVLVGVASSAGKIAGASPVTWMSGWENTGKTVVREPTQGSSANEVVQYTLFSKAFPKGIVDLGGNQGKGENMYMVLAKPYGKAVSIPKRPRDGGTGPLRMKTRRTGNNLRIRLDYPHALTSPKVSIFDMGGGLKRTWNGASGAGSSDLDWNLEGVFPGVYFVQVRTDAFADTRTLFLNP